MQWPFTLSPRRWAVGAILALLVTSVPVRAADATAGDSAPTFAEVKAAVDANRLQMTRTLGGAGKAPFAETSTRPCVLVGFELGLGKFFKAEVIYALRPLYRTADGVSRGPDHGLFKTSQDRKKRSKV